jgi:hypothetical protein
MPTAVGLLEGYREKTRRLRTYSVLTCVTPVCVYRHSGLYTNALSSTDVIAPVVSNVMLCRLTMNGKMTGIYFEVLVPN